MPRDRDIRDARKSDPAEPSDPFPTEAEPEREFTPAEKRVLDIAGRFMVESARKSSESICYARQAAQLEAYVTMLADAPLDQIADAAVEAFPKLFGN